MARGKTRGTSRGPSEKDATLDMVNRVCLGTGNDLGLCPFSKPALGTDRYPGCAKLISPSLYIDGTSMITVDEARRAMPSNCERRRV